MGHENIIQNVGSRKLMKHCNIQWNFFSVFLFFSSDVLFWLIATTVRVEEKTRGAQTDNVSAVIRKFFYVADQDTFHLHRFLQELKGIKMSMTLIFQNGGNSVFSVKYCSIRKLKVQSKLFFADSPFCFWADRTKSESNNVLYST